MHLYLRRPLAHTCPGEAFLQVLGAQCLRQRGRREDVQVEGKFPDAQEHADHRARRARVPVPRGFVPVPDDPRVLHEITRECEEHSPAP